MQHPIMPHCNAHAAHLKSPIAPTRYALRARLCASLVLMAELCSAHLLAATVPTEWTVRIGPRSASYQAERRHGDALDLRATLTYNGQPLAYTGPARLYAQTNGMGATWWDLAPCTVSSNVLQATWLPSFDTGADVVDIFLGGPSNYQAAARIRFLPSPGSVPNSLPLPAPTLDFATVQILNPPYYTRQETDSVLGAFASTGTVSRAANANSAAEAEFAMSASWAGRLSAGGSVSTDHFTYEGILAGFAAGTNYTDAVAAEFENGTREVDYASDANTAFYLAGDEETYNATELIRESTNAATAVSSSLVRYALVTPGEWEFSGDLTGFIDLSVYYNSNLGKWFLDFEYEGFPGQSDGVSGDGTELTVSFSRQEDSWHITATRPSLPGHLLDRAVNAVPVAGATTLTLPALVNAGQARDFILMLDIPSSITNTVPAITNLLTFTPSGTETVHYYVDDPSATFPLPTSPGTWSYSFSEFKASWFAVSLKPIIEAAAPGGAK